MMLGFEVSLPPRELFLNYRVRWGGFWVAHRAKQLYQVEVRLVALSAMEKAGGRAALGLPWARAHLVFTAVWPKGRRRPDNDNFGAALKPVRDALGQRFGVGIFKDDRPDCLSEEGRYEHGGAGRLRVDVREGAKP